MPRIPVIMAPGMAHLPRKDATEGLTPFTWFWLLLLAGCLLFAVGVWWGGLERRRAISELPAEALFDHTRAIVETACPHVAAPLRDYCRAQAELLSSFPECDAPCMEAARRVLQTGRGTR